MEPKVNWDEAPDWAQYWAMDANGYAYWYERVPNIDVSDGVWAPAIEVSIEDNCITEFLCDGANDFGFNPADWKNSIVERECFLQEDAQNKPVPRPGAHIWKAWADGHVVQKKFLSGWEDQDPRDWQLSGPDKEPDDWRVKPSIKKLKYRFGLVRKFDLVTQQWVYNLDYITSEDYEKETEEREDFYGWLTEWVTVEVEE